MESTLSATTPTLFLLSKTLNPNRHRSITVGQTLRIQLALLHFRRTTTTTNAVYRRSSAKFGSKSMLFESRNMGVAAPPVWCRLECVSSSASSFASPSSGGGIGGGGGGDGGVVDGGEVEANPVVGGADDASALSSDVIILDVGGMMCEGCASSVKRILESQSQVSSASVSHASESAIVWPISEAKVRPDWQKVVGEELAKHLTTCGFTSNCRGEAATKGEPS